MHKLVVHCKKSEYDVYIGRPSCWGNQFNIGPDGTRDEVVEKYRAWLLSRPVLIERCKRELKGKVLGCWCAPKSCHGDVLAEIANS
jgi:hypothetical protein